LTEHRPQGNLWRCPISIPSSKADLAICDFLAVKYDRVENLSPLPAISPDQMAPIVRNGAHGERELAMARWGMPGPSNDRRLVTSIRNAQSPHRRQRLGKGSRCVVPVTSFCEYADIKPGRMPVWLALAEDRPLFAFAGSWMQWRGVRGVKSAQEGEHELFGLLATKTNWTVAPIRPMFMPVILTTAAEVEQWLEAGRSEALALKRSFPEDALRIVAKGERQDPGPLVAKARSISMKPASLPR
jgi:putative SOS response-associated peptidase YedK